MNSRISRLLLFVVASVGGLLSLASAFSQELYSGKTITMYAGFAPGGSVDFEMRLAAQFLGKHIPGNPGITPINMPGASGIVLTNYIYNITKPDGLTIGIPGPSAFVLAGITGDKSVKYDLSKLTYIGSSGAINQILWLRKGVHIRSVDELRKSKQPIVIGGFASTSLTVVVPKMLARYAALPLHVVPGYPGGNEAALALERGEIDGIFASAANFRADLISSGAVIPILQSFPFQPDVPTIDSAITSEQEKAAVHLAIAAEALGDPLLGPPGMPDAVTSMLRNAYTKMASTPEYQAAAAMRSIDVSRPISGETLQKYAAANLTAISPDTIREYMSIMSAE